MPKTPTSRDIRDTLRRLADPGMTPEQLLEATRRAHPEATKTEIGHAAFATLIEANPQQALALQDMAISQRGLGDA